MSDAAATVTPTPATTAKPGFFASLISWLKIHVKRAPALEVTVSSAANYIIPFVEELDELATPELAPVVNPLLDRVKTGLGALALTIKDASPAGKANVQSVLASLNTNATSLEAAFRVQDEQTQARITGLLQLISGEITAIQAEVGESA